MRIEKNLFVVRAISDPPETRVALALSAKARSITANWKLVPQVSKPLRLKGGFSEGQAPVLRPENKGFRLQCCSIN